MSFFSRLFGFSSKPKINVQKEISHWPGEYKKLVEINNKLNCLLSKNEYIARSEILFLENESEILYYFNVLVQSNMLQDYCVRNNISQESISTALSLWTDIDKSILKHNDDFITSALIHEKTYLDTILSSVDAKISLDEDQRKVVLTDEDNCLVVAGAGAGKTTTVAAKVKYLVEKKYINPRQILVISFTNKAVQELQEKINKNLNIDCPIATFHSTGNAIIRKQTIDKLNIVDSIRLYFVIQDYFKYSVMQNEIMVKNLILFFASYFDSPYGDTDLTTFFNGIAKSNLTTMKSEIENYKIDIIDARTKKAISIQNEMLRSVQEVEIANFLYLNGIDYQYEPIYEYNIIGSNKPYTPDFIIKQDDKITYIEHFGVSEDGLNPRYSQNELNRYKKAVNDKIILHKQHNTDLIFTFSSYTDGKTLIEHLTMLLKDHGYELRPRSNKEIMEKLISSEENRYIRKLVSLLCRFIENFKTNGYDNSEFDVMRRSTTNVRSKLFLDICQECYLEYQKYLSENNCVDFQDMINNSAKILREIKEMKQKLDFKYIIVDEYQDISRQRFNLVSELSSVTDAKIIAVGDDWQSIYAFSGSDITLFTKFEETVGYCKQLKIVRTYRNSQELIDIAGNFIQENPSQIQKRLISPKTIKDPVIIYTFDGSQRKSNYQNATGANYELAKAVETAISQIITYAKEEKKESVCGLF